MKTALFILFIITSFSFGQDLTNKIGMIEVKLIGHYYKLNSDYELTKRKTNWQNRPFTRMYFNSSGTLLKKIKFGKHHNTNLKLVDRIEVYNYANNRLTESITYISDYQKTIHPYYTSKFLYNKKGQLIDDSKFYSKTDSLFHKTTYEYDSSSNKIKTIFNPTYYYQREFDSINRLTSLKQIYNNQLSWEWNYTYSENKRVGIFLTHYNDGKDYSKKEITTYNKKGLLIEIEELYLTKDSLEKKIKIYYDKRGIIKKIEKYNSFNREEGYELISYRQIKVKSKIEISKLIAKKINVQINIE